MDFDVITDSVKKSFDVWKENVLAYVIGLILIMLIAGIIGVIAAVLGVGSIASVVAAGSAGSLAGFGVAILMLIAALIINVLVVGPLGYGFVYMGIKGARGDKVEIKDIFYAFKSLSGYIRSLIYIIIVGLITGILGMIPFIGWLLSIIVAFLLVYAMYIYIMTPSENIVYAIQESFNLVKDNLVETLVAYIVYMILIIIGAILLGIGLLVTAPMAMIFMVYIMKSLNPNIRDGSL